MSMPRFPAITYESIDWDGDRSQIPRSQRHRFTSTYTAAVTPPIADLADLPISAATSAAATEATYETARFDAELGRDLAPFATILLRSESAASSQIEHLTASAKSIGLAELGETSRANANLIVANSRAMNAALELAERLDTSAIIEMHRQLLGQSAPGIVGNWRRQQVWVGGSQWGPHGALFIAPHHDRVSIAMDDLVAFMNRTDLPALVQVAVAHAQFETIHPFPDGNGRTGRALVHSMLRARGVARSLTIPVSAGLLVNTTNYFDALTAYRDGDLDPIVAALAEASFVSIANARELHRDIVETRASWSERVTARRNATVWAVADHLVLQPVTTSPILQQALNVSAPTANAALEQLKAAGIVSNLTGKSRNRIWVAGEILGALDSFAERSARHD